MLKRPPIVVIMGSVDHGKTTLLDYIRKTNIAAREVGGITQSVGAYEIIHKDQRITFIDTPGHEAFSKMRTRGAKTADIAIILVAADDSVKPQTKEAIKIAQDTETPFVVAINKVDKLGANVEKTKNDLMQSGVLLEGFGGNTSFQEISAKTGQGVNELLDLILLAADLENLSYDPAAQANGFILEAERDNRRGIITTTIVKNGTLRQGDFIKVGAAFGKVKILENFLGKAIKEALPSAPVLIVGLESLPKVGEEFVAGKDVTANAAIARTLKPNIQPGTIAPVNENDLRIILKADVSGSLEALSDIIKHLPIKDRKVEIISEGVGDISDSDVKVAVGAGALIIGFRVPASKSAETLARGQNLKIITSDIIYDLTKALEEQLVTGAKASGVLEILAIFGKKGGQQQIIGGKVTDGEIKTNTTLKITRKAEVLGEGKIINLQQAKKDAPVVKAGLECGLLFESAIEIKVGDILLAA